MPVAAISCPLERMRRDYVRRVRTDGAGAGGDWSSMRNTSAGWRLRSWRVSATLCGAGCQTPLAAVLPDHHTKVQWWDGLCFGSLESRSSTTAIESGGLAQAQVVDLVLNGCHKRCLLRMSGRITASSLALKAGIPKGWVRGAAGTSCSGGPSEGNFHAVAMNDNSDMENVALKERWPWQFTGCRVLHSSKA